LESVHYIAKKTELIGQFLGQPELYGTYQMKPLSSGLYGDRKGKGRN